MINLTAKRKEERTRILEHFHHRGYNTTIMNLSPSEDLLVGRMQLVSTAEQVYIGLEFDWKAKTVAKWSIVEEIDVHTGDKQLIPKEVIDLEYEELRYLDTQGFELDPECYDSNKRIEDWIYADE